MAAEFVAHAFERFRQSNASGTRKSGGLGLGLSIVKNLIEIHGGSVRARSEGEGKGSTFVVNLPVMVLRPAGETHERVHPKNALASNLPDLSISLRGLRVLVVDDENDARDLLRRVLKNCDAEVATAASAKEAIELVERLRPDVLVSDIGMPEMDGYELIRRVRMLGEGAGSVRAIALTAFARLEDRTRAMLAGYQMHLAKPVDPKELMVTVANLAGRITTQA
jgi:CheY-like chemotaxis protein